MKKLLKKLFDFLDNKYPSHLKINGREKLSHKEFEEDDNLYHGFDENDLDENNNIIIETIKFPDLSCNWSRFSEPKDVRYRVNCSEKDGCYSFSVETSRYNSYATPVHDPLYQPSENYSHIEVRELRGEESVDFEPPKGRNKQKSNIAKSRKLAYRHNIVKNINIELEIEESL